MAPKRPNPMEDPPAASSDEEEHSSSAGEEETDGDDSSSGEEDDSPAAPTVKNVPPPRPDSKTLAPPASARPQTTQPSDDEDRDDGVLETESDSDAPPSVNVKPIATKPMEKEAPKASKSSSKPAPPAAKSPAKRPTAPEQGKREVKRARKEDGLKEIAKKSPFHRLWSEEDEIVILKGMLDFSKMKGADPLTQIDEFTEFIKKSFPFDFSRTQLFDKIKRLKKKYKDSLENGKKGTKPHEQKSFDLSEKFWGNEGLVLGLESAAVLNGKARKNQNRMVNKKALTSSSSKPEPIPSAVGSEQGKISENETELGLSRCLSNPSLLDEMDGPGGFEASIMKRVKGVIDESKRVELEKKWRKLKIAELELYLERKALFGEQAKLLLGHYKSLDK